MPDNVILMVDDTTSLVSPWKTDVAKVARIVPVMGGIEALARLRENASTFMVLINLSLKRVNGLDALMKIREKNPKLPILILASSEDKPLVQQALAFNIQDLLLMPVNSSTLMEKIAKFLPVPQAPTAPVESPKPSTVAAGTENELTGLKEKYYQAQSAFANGDFDTAVKLFLEISAEKQLKDSHLKYVEESYYQAGRCLIKKGDLNRAIDVLKQFLTRAPKSLLTRQALFQIGTAYELQGDPTKAVNFYAKVVSLADTDSLASQAKKQINKLNGTG
jgi:CheY-like chemotaxis protein